MLRANEHRNEGQFGPATPAGMIRRIRAFAWDGLLVVGYAATLGSAALIFTKFSPGSLDRLFATRVGSQTIGWGVLTIPVIVAIGWSDSDGAGFGKRHVGLRVEHTSGRPPGAWRSILRTACKLVPWELAHTALWEFRFRPNEPAGVIALAACYTLAIAYLVTAALDRQHRTPYDALLRTRVVEADP